MPADITLRAGTAPLARRRFPTFGLSWRILGLVIVAVMTAELLLFLPSIARYPPGLSRAADRERHAGGAGARRHARQHGDRRGQARAAQPRARRRRGAGRAQQAAPRALLNIPPRPDMPTFNLKERGALGLIWDALAAMTRDGAYYTRVGGESMRLPRAMVWIVVDELPMRHRDVRLQRARAGAVDHHRAVHRGAALPRAALAGDPAAAGSVGRHGRVPPRSRGGAAATGRAPSRNDEIGVVDREFQNLQRELRASLRQKSRLAEVGAASNKINHDLRNILSTARLLSDRLAQQRRRAHAQARADHHEHDRPRDAAWPAKRSNMCATGRRRGSRRSISPTWSTRSASPCRSRARTPIPTCCATG